MIVYFSGSKESSKKEEKGKMAELCAHAYFIK